MATLLSHSSASTLAQKIRLKKIIRAWVTYLDLASLVNATVENSNDDDPVIYEKGISLIDNNLFIDEKQFKDLKDKYSKEKKKNSSFKVAVTFPKIYQVVNGSRQFQPLFTIDVSKIFEGNYHKLGWNLLDGFEFQPVIPNLIDVAEIDEEKAEQLVTREGLRTFLEDTFPFHFNTLQNFLNFLKVSNPAKTIQSSPYLVRYDFSPYTHNLKKDLQKILDNAEWWDWLLPGYPAYEYLFGCPQSSKESIWYAGAFPTYTPTDSQAKVFKHLWQNPVTPVVGPPGCSKTVSIAHAVAMVVSDRAIRLATTGQDESCLTLITSTNNRAVQQAEMLLKSREDLPVFYLSGGAKDLTAKQVLPVLLETMTWLKNTQFNQEEYQAITEALSRAVDSLNQQEKEDEVNQPKRQHLSELLENLNQNINNLRTELDALSTGNLASTSADYANFPLDAYERIQRCLEQVRHRNRFRRSEGSPVGGWFQRIYSPLRRFFQWFIREYELFSRSRLYGQLTEAIEQTQETSFPIDLSLPLTQANLDTTRNYVKAQIQSARIEQERSRLRLALTEHHTEREAVEKELSTYPDRDFYSRFYSNEFHKQQQYIFKLSLQLLRQEALRRKEEVLNSLQLYASILEQDNYDATAYRRLSSNWPSIYRDLSLLFPVLTSTLNSIRNLLPFPDSGSLAYVFADEAGTTGIHQLFPALVRAKKALVVGDPLQLQPIMSLSGDIVEHYYQTAFIGQGLTDEDYDLYSPTAHDATSAYQRAAGVQGTRFGKGNGIILIDHFRCPSPIASISDALGEYGLVVKTRGITPVLGTHLIATDIRGNQESLVNCSEIEAIVEWVRILYSNGYSFGSKVVEKSIGVISPYRKQANALRHELHKHWSDCNEENTNTIHTFQGGEKAIVLLSTRQSEPTDSLLFLNRGPNLLNVAVSRATESLILVGNLERLREGAYSRVVVEHIDRYGEIKAPADYLSGSLS